MGTLHVVTGADHISAVASLAVGNSPSRAFALGARWGAGHSVGLLCVFLFLLALRVETDEAFMRVASRWMGLGVGAFMVALGVYGVLEVDQRLRDAERDGDALPDADDPERARLVTSSKKNDDEDATVSDDEKTKRRGMNASSDHSKDGRKPSSFLTGSLAVLAGVVHGAAGPGASSRRYSTYRRNEAPTAAHSAASRRRLAWRSERRPATAATHATHAAYG